MGWGGRGGGGGRGSKVLGLGERGHDSCVVARWSSWLFSLDGWMDGWDGQPTEDVEFEDGVDGWVFWPDVGGVPGWGGFWYTVHG